MLSVRGLYKFYGDFLALEDVSFDVGEGEVVGFLGPNGAGKSTTMKTLVGFLPASRGRVTVDGLDVRRHPLETRRRIGYLPEHTPVYPDMRVREYLDYRAQIKGVPRAQRKQRVDYVLEATQLDDRTRQTIETLSKGLKQRVGIADALVADPRLLVLDEPTIGLDPNQVREVRSLVEELAQRHTILLSTHILSEVERVCSRAVIVARGRVVADDTLEGLRERYREQAVRVTLRADHTTEHLRVALAGLPGVAEVQPLWEEHQGTRQRFRVGCAQGVDEEVVAEAVAALAAREGWPLSELTPQRPSLEEIFARLTMGELRGSAAGGPEQAA
ncbi:MAG: ABC transporter ATP-binding protein [Planctomycetota bacterium]